MDISQGDFELTFESGETIYFRGGGDGETLRLRTEPWSDPFAEPLSLENRSYVESSGKLSKVDVTSWHAYERLDGAVLHDFEPVFLQDGRLNALVLHFEPTSVVRVGIIADETIVDVA